MNHTIATERKHQFCRKNYKYLLSVMLSSRLLRVEAIHIISYMERLEETYGAKWLVNHLKERYQSLLSEGPFRLHSDGTWYGPFRPISRLARRGRKGLRRALRILKVHGVFIAPAPNLKSYLQVAVDTSKDPENDMLYIPQEIPSLLRKSKYAVQTFDRQYPLSSRRVPIEPGLKYAEVFITPKLHIDLLDHCPQLVLKHYPLISRVVGESMRSTERYLALLNDAAYERDYAGDVTILVKDGSLKERPVVSTFPLIQQCLSRLHNSLFKLLEKLPCCYVYNQEEGAEWGISCLREGRSLSSIDLKSASDNIPLRPQIELAKQLFPSLEEEIDLFREVARTTFWTSKGVDIVYTRGHPMGVKGSFPLFTVFLIYGLLRSGGSWSDFAVVGDDLILDASLTDRFLGFLYYNGIPISVGKSLINHARFAEFVGRVLDKHGDLLVFKASPLKLEEDPLGLVRQYGKAAIRHFGLVRLLGWGRLKALTRYMELGSQSSMREFLALAVANVKDSKFLAGRKIPAYSVGGAPRHIVESMISEINDDWMRSFYQDKLNEDDPSLGERIMHNPELTWGVHPIHRLQCWHFAYNSRRMVEEFRHMPFSPLLEVDGVAVKPYDHDLSMVSRYLSESVPDVERNLRDAVNKRLPKDKVDAAHRRKNVTRLSYILKFDRIARQAIDWLRKHIQ